MNRCARLLFLIGLLTGGCGFLGEEEPASIVDSELVAAEPVVDAPTREEFAGLYSELESTKKRLGEAEDVATAANSMIEDLEEIVAPICFAKPLAPSPAITFATPVPTNFQATLSSAQLGEIITASLDEDFYYLQNSVEKIIGAALEAVIKPLLTSGESVYDLLGKEYEGWWSGFVEMARGALANPTTLNATYALVKPSITASVAKWDASRRKEWLLAVDEALPVLVTPVPADLERAIWYETQVYDKMEALGAPCENILRKYTLAGAREKVENLLPADGPLSKVDAEGATGNERSALYFGIRRKKEGGPALVSAWAEILKDFKSTIEAANTAAEKPAETVAEQPIANPPATLADTSTCTGGLLRPDTFPKGKGRWGAKCGGHLYVIGSTVAVDKKNVHTDLTLLPEE